MFFDDNHAHDIENNTFDDRKERSGKQHRGNSCAECNVFSGIVNVVTYNATENVTVLLNVTFSVAL